MSSILTRLTRVLTAVAVTLGFAVLAQAQAINTAPLSGVVRTDDGQAVANANVTITHEPTATAIQAVAGTDGAFTVRGLRPGGPYTVAASAAGREMVSLKDIYLEVEAGANVTVVMQSEDIVHLDAYLVTASSNSHRFDPAITDSGKFLNQRDIENTVSVDRSLNSLMASDPRISYNPDPWDKAFSASGINNRYNLIQVDGVSVSDPFGLNASNLATERNVISIEAIEGVAISTTPYDVRKSGFTGASVNVITKSGGNDFHGAIYYTFRSKDFVGEKLDGAKYPLSTFKEQTMGLSIGGPIVPKKLFFYVNYEHVDEDRLPAMPTSWVAQEDLDKIIAAAKHLGWTDVGTPYPGSTNKLKDDTILAKVDWQINADHRLTAQYKYTDATRPTFPSMGGSGNSQNNISFSSRWYDKLVKNQSIFAQLVSRWTDKLNTELSISYSNYQSEPDNTVRRPNMTVRNVPVPGSSNSSYVSFGTDYNYQANELDTKTYTTELFANYALNSQHTLQAGIQYEMADVYNLYLSNAFGAYTFSGTAQFFDIADPVTGTNDGSKTYLDYYFNQRIPGVDPAAQFKESRVGVFVRDQWKIHPKFSFDLGLRLDTALVPDDVPYNQKFHDTFHRRNDNTYDGKMTVQPRIGFNWQPTISNNSLRTVIRGGFGLFQGTMPRVWLSNSYANTGMNYIAYRGGSPIVSADPDRQNVGTINAMQSVAYMEDGFKLPSRWKANIELEREIGLWGMVFSVGYEWSRVNDDVRFININIAQSVVDGNKIMGPDGRIMYWRTYNASTGFGDNYLAGSYIPNRVSTDFAPSIIGLTNTSQGESSVFTIALDRPRKKDGWSWGASYTHTNSTIASFGNSSTPSSNWENQAYLNPDDNYAYTSDLEIRHRVMVRVSKELNLLSIGRTQISLTYNGHSGLPFSMVSSGDLNGDSITYNDLMYIPRRDDSDPKYTFTSTAEKENFYKIVDRFELREGAVVARNGQRYPWVNQFDLHISQEVKLPYWRHALEFCVDFYNIGNMLNDEWGLIRGSNQFFEKSESMARVRYNQNNGTYVIDNVSTDLANNEFNPYIGRGEPAATRWSILFSVKYKF
jgi:outer membrane receptor for ferrienterochelin and colicin